MLSKSAVIPFQFVSESEFFVANRVNVPKYFGTVIGRSHRVSNRSPVVWRSQCTEGIAMRNRTSRPRIHLGKGTKNLTQFVNLIVLDRPRTLSAVDFHSLPLCRKHNSSMLIC